MTARAVAVDGLRPVSVERPADEAEVARLLAAAAAAGSSVVPLGGGRLLGMGNRLDRLDLVLDMTALDAVIEHSPADLTISVQAGITLESLNEMLARSGQFLPLDPPGGPGHTIGGLLATGLSGPLRLRYGSARDFLIGLRVALPDGRLATSGGRVVKNVSGYDMNKLHLGALGALGVIVAATFKVFPRPLYEVAVETRTDRPWAEAQRALSLTLPPVALEVAHDGRVLARMAGSEGAVKRTVAGLGWSETDASFWDRHARRTAATWARISVPPRPLPQVIDGLPDGAQWWASPGVGTAHWTGWDDPGAVTAARQAAEAAGGSLVIVDAPAEIKTTLDAWGARPDTLETMRRLRDAFDPGRTISPGRFVV